MPAGQLPIWIEPVDDQSATELKTDLLPKGETYSQANAILRMLGNKLGYSSDDAEEMYDIDWAIETFGDYWNTKLYRTYLKADPIKDDIMKLTQALTKFNQQVNWKLGQ